MHLFDLPKEILTEILEYISYDQISRARLVCRRFDQLCQEILNRGFNKAIKMNNASFKRIKALLPRRESERRNHVLARHADILTSIETRLSMLSMTYGKFIDFNLCCFIPGRVLDEIFSVLRLIAKSTIPLRPHEILQELRDISSMAIEHFDDKISATLKKSYIENKTKTLCVSNIGDNGRISIANLALSSPTGLGSISFRVLDDETPSIFKTYNSDLMEVSTSKNAGSPTSSGTLINKSQQQQQQQQLSDQEVQQPQQQQQYSFKLRCGNNAATISSVNDDGTGGSGDNGGHTNCPACDSLMTYCKKLKMKYKKGCLMMRHMQYFQSRQTKRLHQTIKTVRDLKLEIVELKKRLDEVDAKNREISANMKHINPDSNDNSDNTNMKSSVSTTSNKDNHDHGDVIIDRPIDPAISRANNFVTKRPGIKRAHQTDADNHNICCDSNVSTTTSSIILKKKPRT